MGNSSSMKFRGQFLRNYATKTQKLTRLTKKSSALFQEMSEFKPSSPSQKKIALLQIKNIKFPKSMKLGN
ncbi:hypothetical protein SUGI_0466850 [Cryptomeria japonica]|nr:hypothetical protein SUGI_0466850 [Cryptomeria japonica]